MFEGSRVRGAFNLKKTYFTLRVRDFIFTLRVRDLFYTQGQGFFYTQGHEFLLHSGTGFFFFFLALRIRDSFDFFNSGSRVFVFVFTLRVRDFLYNFFFFNTHCQLSMLTSFGVRFTPVLPQSHVKDPGHSGNRVQ